MNTLLPDAARIGGTRPWIRLAGVSCALAAVLVTAALPAAAAEVRFERVTENVFAFIGETGGRTYENEGLNANIGLIVTAGGAVLIDSGASHAGGRRIHEAARRVTNQPVRWVINTGGQDHRWLGNGYFRSQGIEVIAHAAARSDMLGRGHDQLHALKQVLKERLDGTEPVLPNRWVDGEDAVLELGGTRLELKYRGGAHTPGDLMVWLPASRVLFSGDVVYVDRMLGVLPVSSTRRWLASFDVIEQLAPQWIVPGHGRVTDAATARADTQDYLRALRTHMLKAVEDGVDLTTAIRTFDAAPFRRLLNSAELHPGNASRTYLEVERE